MNTAIAIILLSLLAVCHLISVLSRSQPYDANGDGIRGDGNNKKPFWPVSLLGQDTQYFNANNEDWSKEIDTRVRMTFRNDLPVAIDLYYESENAILAAAASPNGTPRSSAISRKFLVTISSNGGEVTFQTHPGHKFSYNFGGFTHFATAPATSGHIKTLLGKETEIRVRCTTTGSGSTETKLPLDIKVIPHWSPHGASHFLDLVRVGYYNGAALSRVIPGFLAQFGISPDYDLKMEYKDKVIPDDPRIPVDQDHYQDHEHEHNNKRPITFQPGMISFAGNNPHTRSTEVFIVMPDTKQVYLDRFGTINPWETPFAIIENFDSIIITNPSPNSKSNTNTKTISKSVANKWHSYGDASPLGSGPSRDRMFQKDGYEYLKKEFPKMDYIEECHVIDIEPGMLSTA